MSDDYRGPRGNFRRNTGPREMHKATCSKQLVQSVIKNARYHSNHLKASQFTVEIVI